MVELVGLASDEVKTGSSYVVVDDLKFIAGTSNTKLQQAQSELSMTVLQEYIY